MADTREVFTILEDDSTAAGVKLPARAEGDAAAGNHLPAVVSKDTAGNYELIQLRDQGDAVSGSEVPVLPVRDSSGNLQHIPLDAAGHIPVTAYPVSEGTKISDNAIATGVLNTDVDVVTLTLAASTQYEKPQFMASATQVTHWDVVHNNDGTPAVLGSFMTGPGQYSFAQRLEDLVFTSGASGTQELKLIGQQKFGAATDLHGFLSVQTV